jgi:hypothetical protein
MSTMAQGRLGPDGHARVAAHVHTRAFDGELVVLDLDGGDYFGLDPLGSRLWRGLEQGSTPAEIATSLVGEYDVGYDRLLADLVTLADELVGRGLLVPSDERT